MKLKAIVFATALGLLGASFALAAPPAGKGKPSATGLGCKPGIAVILKGTLAGDGGTVPFALSVNVTGGILWVSVCLFSGYFFGNLPLVKQNFSLVVIAIVFISLLPAVIEYLRHRAQAKRQATHI